MAGSENRWGMLRARLPGVALCAAVALAALGLGQSALGASLGSAVLAMAVGIALAQLLPAVLLEAGTDWVVKALLPLGIVLLGARVQASDLLGLGLQGVALGIGVIAVSGGFFFLLARAGWLAPRLAILLALGNGICGGSAIAAAAPVLGARRDEIAASVAAIVVVGTLGTIALPLLGSLLELSASDFGLWAGLSLQQTPQVIAAGMSHGPEAGAVATTAKLVRISLLVPVIFGLAALRGGAPGERPRARVLQLVPGFLWGFVALSAAGSLSLLPEVSVRFEPSSWFGGFQGVLGVRPAASLASEGCMILAMAAIGLQTRWDSLTQVGPGALAAAVGGACVVTSAVGLVVLKGL